MGSVVSCAYHECWNPFVEYCDRMWYCDKGVNNIVCIDTIVIYMEKCVTLVLHLYTLQANQR